MNDQLNTLNTYFWNVGNDIADIRLLTEGALALFEGDAEPLHRLGMKNNAEVAASAFDTIGTRCMICVRQSQQCSRAICLRPSGKAWIVPTNNYNDARQNQSVGHFLFVRHRCAESVVFCIILPIKWTHLPGQVIIHTDQSVLSKNFEKVLILWKKTAFLMPIYYEGVRKY